MNLWIRAETKEYERRTPIVPKHADILIKQGISITVESSTKRIYRDDEFSAVGCQIAAEGSWPNAKFNTFILGIKELPQANFDLIHKHIYYADAFERHQMGDLLRRFKKGRGLVYDYEYMLNSNHQAVINSGFWAGYCGAATALLLYANQALPPFFNNKLELDHTIARLTLQETFPKALIIGAGGAVAKGVMSLLDRNNISYKKWYKNETLAQESYNTFFDVGLLFNCVALKQHTKPFITNETLRWVEKKLLIQDISCFLGSKFGNPIPLYDSPTTFHSPIHHINSKVDVVAIDHLPTLLPRESSEAFSMMLLPHLLQLYLAPLLENSPWKKAEKYFKQAIRNLVCE